MEERCEDAKRLQDYGINNDMIKQVSLLCAQSCTQAFFVDVPLLINLHHEGLAGCFAHQDSPDAEEMLCRLLVLLSIHTCLAKSSNQAS